MTDILRIQNLSIKVKNGNQLVDNVSLSVKAGQVTALVGESGSGKSITALSIPQLLSDALEVTQGTCFLQDTNLFTLDKESLRKLRGDKISIVFQEPMTALNPLHTIEKQIYETLLLHNDFSKKQCHDKVLELLQEVEIQDAEKKRLCYPHELSGGQRQRVMIAIALANNPDLLILDEPTTALDVTVQAQILKLLKKIRQKTNMAMLLISHDLDMVAQTADDIYVMQAGKIIEYGLAKQIMHHPTHEYTRYLIDAVPKGKPDPINKMADIVLKVDNLCVTYPIKTGFLKRITDYVYAVSDFNVTLHHGETLGIVGESGSGKSTFANALLQLTPYTGQVTILKSDMSLLSRSDLRKKRCDFQPIFQDPYGALSPRMRVQQILLEGLNLHRKDLSLQEKIDLIAQILSDISLDPVTTLKRYPHEFSGGQRQRIAIARALVLKPKLLILDEPTSALDRTVQKQVLDLLKGLQQKYGLTFVFISHDLGVVRSVSHQLIVMKQGKIIEAGVSEEIFNNPQQTYTQKLLKASTEYIL
jgi:microcin C transport system ATP-binding protein